MAMRRRELTGTHNLNTRAHRWSAGRPRPARTRRYHSWPSTSTDHRRGEAIVTPSGHGNRGRRSKGARRLEIIGAVRTIARTADQITAHTAARLAFDVIGTCGDPPDDKGEHP